jgi:hypothetical protein
MGWLILSGKANQAGYDRELQFVRHNGTTGEVGDIPYVDGTSQVSGIARLSFADPYIYFRHSRGVDRGLFDAWPPTLQQTSFFNAGTPAMLDVVFKSGSTYCGYGANASGGSTPYAITSTGGVDFYARELISGTNDNTKIILGKNGRFVFLMKTSESSFYYTDNFVDFTKTGTGIFANSIQHFEDAAGTSDGKWVFCRYQYLTPIASYVSTNNLSTFTEVSALAFHRVWAFGTTLYGAVGGTLYSSTDGTTWTSKGTPLGSASLDIYDITYDGSSTYLIVGELGNAVTTTAFSTYTALPGYDFAGHALFGAVYVDDSILYPVVVPPFSATIQGTLRLDTSDGAFAARTVYLYNYTTGDKVAQTTSDGSTGAWSFTQVAPGEYFVVGAAQGDDLNIPRDFDALGVITVV